MYINIYIYIFQSLCNSSAIFSACSRAISLDWVSLADFAAKKLPKKERSTHDLPTLPAGRQLSPPQWEAPNIP